MSTKTIETTKTVVKFGVIGLVALFVGAATNNIVDGVKAVKLAKIGAKAGGILLGIYAGKQVSDFACEFIDGAGEKLDEIKETIEEGEE